MLKIRFQRIGRKKAPFFRVVVAEQSQPVNSRFIETLGHFNPNTKETSLNKERIEYWISVGAQPSDRFARLGANEGITSCEKYIKGRIMKPSKAEQEAAKKAEEDKKLAEEAAKQAAEEKLKAEEAAKQEKENQAAEEAAKQETAEATEQESKQVAPEEEVKSEETPAESETENAEEANEEEVKENNEAASGEQEESKESK